MPIWVAVLTSSGCRLSRLAHSTAMISAGRSRPGSPRCASAGMSSRPSAKSPGSPAAACPGRVSPRARIPDRAARVLPAEDVAVVAADHAGRLEVGQPVEERFDVGAAQPLGRQAVIVTNVQALGQPGQGVDLLPDVAGTAAAVPG